MMYALINLVLFVGLGAFFVFLAGTVNGIIEYKAHGFKKHENLYYDMLTQEQIDEYFNFKKKVLPIVMSVFAFLSFVLVYMFSDTSFFMTLCRVGFVWMTLFLGYHLYLKEFSPFRNRPEPAQTIVKKDS